MQGGWQMRPVSVNGVVLNYSDQGYGEGPCLVFSNSLGTDYRIWQGVAEHLSNDYRLIFYDKRGHGLSSAPEAPYTMDQHIGDLTGLLDHLDIKNTIVVGLSVGGLIGQGLAARRPDLVQALVLSDTAPKIGTDEMWSARIAAIREAGLEGAANGILERWFSQDLRESRPIDVTLWRHMLVRTPIEGYLGTCQAIMATDFTEAARRLDLPVLCVVGSEDGATPVSLVKAMADIIPGSQFEVIDGAGHLPCVEKPEQFAALVKAFVAKHNLD